MKTKIFIFLLGILLINSCSEDFITKDFDKSRYVPGSFFTDKAHAEQALNAAYAGLNAWGNGYTWDVGIMHFVQGDDFAETGYAAGFGTWGPVSNFDLTNSYGQFNGIWNAYYRNILACNEALAVMPEAQAVAGDPSFTQAVLDNWMGQAYFLRAFFYYNLYQYYPDDRIIIRDAPPASSEEFALAPSSSEETFAFIENDLKQAQTLLTNGLNVTAGYEKGRVTRGSAAALLGKLYIYKGEYAKAAAEFKKVLPGVGDAAYGTYSLTNSYRDNFITATENNSESIFEIQFTDLTGGSGFANNDVNWVFQNFTLNRTSWAIMWWNFAIPNFKLNEYEKWTETIGGTPTTVYDYRVYETLWGVPNGAKFTENGVVKDWIAQGWSVETVLGQSGGVYSLRKYAKDDSNDHGPGLDPLWSDANIRIIRLGDVMLLYAECLANLNPSNLSASDPNSAIYWVDMIRNRANNVMNDQAHLYSARPGVRGQLPTATALKNSKGWTLMELIEHERYVEGYAEGWWKEDVKRWKKGASYKNIASYKPLWKGWESLILPVPLNEINNNPNMPKE